MEAIQQQMVETKKDQPANPWKELKQLCKEFGFTTGIFTRFLAESREKL